MTDSQIDYLLRAVESQNGINHKLIGAIEGMNRLDDYRGQQIAGLEAQVKALQAAVRASFADPADVAEAMHPAAYRSHNCSECGQAIFMDADRLWRNLSDNDLHTCRVPLRSVDDE